MTAFTESIVEDAALAWLEPGVRQVAHRSEIGSDIPVAERAIHSAQARVVDSGRPGYSVAVRNCHANEVSVLGIGAAGGGV